MPSFTIACYDNCDADNAENIAREALEESGYRYSDRHECYLCSSDAVEVDGEYYHNEDDDVSNCEECNDTFIAGDGDDVRTDDGTSFCSCNCAERADYSQNNDGEWLHEDDDRNHPNGAGRLASWSSSNSHLDSADNSAPYRLGVEVEKEDSDSLETVASDCIETRWLASADGSLNGDGFELVSPAWNLRDWNTIRAEINSMEHIDAETSIRCGGHITASVYGESGPALAERVSDCVPLLYALYPCRLNTQWAPARKKDNLRATSEKYRAVNVMHDRVEFRIFSRIDNRKQLLWRLELVEYLIRIGRPTIADSLADPLSWLSRHLCKVYSAERLTDKISLFQAFAEWHTEERSHGALTIRPYVSGHNNDDI